jgi:hypothetical protein
MKRFLVLLAACAPSVPDEPSFQRHVAPILNANCIRCHGVPALGGAPSSFRLDTYAGAQLMADEMVARVSGTGAPMPPRFPLDDYQIDTLSNWAAAGAPRGEPRAGNRRPTAVVTSIVRRIDEEGTGLRVRYLIDLVVDDPDGDVTGGTLHAAQLPIGLVHSGPNHVVWETTNVPPGTFALEAVLDDGAAEIAVPLGDLAVESL